MVRKKKKIVFIEPFKTNELSDRPDLGSAMIVGGLRRAGFNITNLGGQEIYFPEILANDGEELFHILNNNFSDELYKKLDLFDFYNFANILGKNKFILYLYSLNDRVERDKINIRFLKELNYIFKSIMLTLTLEVKKGNYNIGFLNRIISKLKYISPELICISIMYFDELLLALCKGLHKDFKNIKIIVGGALFSVLDEDQIKKFMIDCGLLLAIRGEGEQSLADFAFGRNYNDISGLIYKDGNKYIFNNIKQIQKLDSLAFPDFDNIKFLFKLFKILPIQLSRGCTWRKCKFCSHHFLYANNFRRFEYEWVIKLLKYYKNKYKCNHYVIQDEELPPGIVLGLCNALEKSRLKNIYFYGYARLSSGYNNIKLLKKMYNTGFRVLSWGVESGSQKILNRMEKGILLKDVPEILKKSALAGIENICWFIIGFPGETDKDREKTKQFILKNNDFISFLMLSKFELLINTDIYKNSIKYNIKINKVFDNSPVVKFSYFSSGQKQKIKQFIYNLTKRSFQGKIKTTNEKYNLPLFNMSRMMLFKLSSVNNISSGKNSVKL